MKRIPLIFLQLMKWKLSNLIYFLILLGKFYFFKIASYYGNKDSRKGPSLPTLQVYLNSTIFLKNSLLK